MRLGALVAVALCVAAATASRASIVEYLYVDANVGSSVAGHVAIHFGDAGLVFDYQNDELDNLRLRRLRYEHFRYLYSVRGNRTIHVARVEVAETAYEALLSRFNRALLVQDKQYRVLGALRRDRELASLLSDPGLADRSRGDPGPELPLRGAGFFYAGEEAGPQQESRTLSALRARVASRHGKAFLDARLEALTREVAGIDLLATPATAGSVSKAEVPRLGYLPSERFLDLSLQILALRALAEARPLRAEAHRSGPSEGFALDPGERDRIRAFADALEGRLAELTASRRPDWGFALLLGMARLEVLRRSAATGRLVLLDAIPEHAPPLSPDEVEDSRAYLEELAAWSRRRFVEERTAFFAGGPPREADLARLEATASRYLEIDRGLTLGRPVRVRAGELAPERSARGVEVPLPRPSPAVLRAVVAQSEARLRDYEAALHGAIGYHLVTHNCVTEIFAMLGAEAKAPELGGVMAAPGLVGAIPFLSHRRFVDATTPSLVGEVPSVRRQRVEEMYAEENDLVVHLREANTLTSTIYRRNANDSRFLFFTDDVLLLRPVYGAVNLIAGAGEMVIGLLEAPFDRGQTLWSGAKGALFSLPELAFVNIRKGSFDYAPSSRPRTSLRSYGASETSAREAGRVTK